MVKKLLSLILASLIAVSCFPIASQAAEFDDYSSGASTITLDDVSKNNIIDIIVSIDPVSNVQGILLDLDKAYSKFQYQGYEVLDSSLDKGSVVVNSSPVDYTYTDIMAALQFPDGGVSYSQKTDLIKFKFKARSAFSGFAYNFSVKEFYDSNLKDISSSALSIRYINESKSEKTLSSIKVTAPSKTTYNVGESFDSSGMAVTAVYSDSSTKIVTDSVTVDGFSSTAAGTKTVTVSYTEGSLTKTASFTVTVKAAELSSIAVTSKPTVTTYYIGQSLNTSGMKITAAYSDGTSKDVTSGVTTSGFSSTAAGTKTVTVSYTEGSVTKTASFSVTVKAVEVTSIAVTSKPTKTTYYVGDSFDKSGLKVTATYNNGTTSDVTSSVTLSGFDSTSAGTKTVTASYSGKTATFAVTVSAVEVKSIAVTSKPTKTTYYVGDSFDKTGLKVTATYNNGNTADVTSSAALSGFSSTSAGTKNITVTYGGKTATFAVTVLAVEVTSIAVTSNPTKTIYYVDESFDKTGLKVTATYNNGKTADVTSSAALSGFNSTSTGTKTVTVTYANKSASFTVTVKEALKNNSTISSENIKIGNSVTVTGKASGGSSGYTYAFYYKLSTSSSWTTNGTAYGSATSMTLSPVNHGTYNIKVNVKDSEGHIVSKEFTLTVSYSDITNKSAVSNSVSGDIGKTCVGDEIKITAAASGGSGKYAYTYFYKESTSSSWTALSSASFTPSKAVTYNIRVTASDTYTGETIAPVSKDFTVAANPKLVNNSTVGSTQYYLEDVVNIKGSAAGGLGAYTYTYKYKKSDESKWTAISSDTAETSVSFTPTSQADYDLSITVKDGNGRTVEKTYKINVGAALKNTSAVDYTERYLNDTVTITGSATGGAGGYKYTYSYKKSSDSSWTAISTDTANTSAKFTVKEKTNYNVKIAVKDSGSRTKEVNYTIKVIGDAVANTSTIDKTLIYLGETIKITGSATGGTGKYTYEYSYELNSSGSWEKITSASWTPTAAGKYKIKVTAKDSGGRTAAKTFSSVTVLPKLVNTSTVSSASTKTGSSVTITGAATGGSGTYTYAYYYKRAGSDADWTVKGTEYGTAKSVKLTPAFADTYTVKVSVKDSNGREVSKTFDIAVGASAVKNNSTISTTSTKTESSVKITGAASGGTGVFTYAFYYKLADSSKWTTIGTAYGTAKSATFKPTIAGEYTVSVIAKDSEGTKKSKSFTVTVGASALQNNSTISAAETKTESSVKVTGAAKGGTGVFTYAYEYQMKGAAKWTAIREGYSAYKSAAFKPTIAGEYTVRVKIKDSAGTIKSKTFDVTVGASAVKNNSTISTTSTKTESSVKITGVASGGTGIFTYAFYYKLADSSNWTTIGTAYGTAKSAAFKPTIAGEYTVSVIAKDSEGTKKGKSFTVTVAASALKNNSTISTTSTKTESSVKITGAASGGTGIFTYAYEYQMKGASKWTAIRNGYSTYKSATFKPTIAGEYTVRVKIKDSAGTIKSKTFDVTVGASAVKNNSTISTTSTKTESSVKITGAASGGTGVFTYAFYYKLADSSKWTTIGTAYGTAKSASFKPAIAGEYTVSVIAKDSEGTKKGKSFTVTVGASALKNNSTISAEETKTESSVKITGAASGGTGVFTYAYEYQMKGASKWTAIRDGYSAYKSAAFKPTIAGEYTVRVKIKDSAGTIKSKTFDVTVGASALQNNSTVSATSVKVGEAVKINGAAKGGTGIYTYAFYYKRAGSKADWTVKGTEFGTAASATLKPAFADTYTVKAVIKDSNGTTAEKIFTITATDTATEVAALVNAERAKVGLPALTVNSTLNKLAEMKSQDMHDNNYFDHISPTYGSPFDMVENSGVSFTSVGENIAMGQKTPEEVMNSWMNSEGHKANILSSKYKQIGIGYVADGNYWTQIFIG